jgi:hypothetical protein
MEQEIKDNILKLDNKARKRLLKYLEKLTKTETWYLYYKNNYGHYDGTLYEYTTKQECEKEYNKIKSGWDECAYGLTCESGECDELLCDECTEVAKHKPYITKNTDADSDTFSNDDNSSIDTDYTTKTCDDCYDKKCDDCTEIVSQIIDYNNHDFCCGEVFELYMSTDPKDFL